MKLFKPLSLGTNLFKGYSLEEALDLVKEAKFEYAELSSIINMCEHIDPKQISEEYAAEVKKMLDQKELKCHAVSGHVDLTEEDQLQDFLKKIEFSGRIGAKIINTNSGPASRLDIFKKNMPRIIAMAEKWNVIIGLESHGDIISTAQESVSIFRYYNHPLVRLNYDTGNTLFYSSGHVVIEEDIKYGLEFLEHLHLKDIIISNQNVEYCPIGDGNVNFPAVFDVLKQMGHPIPCGLEIPVHVKGVLGAIKPTNTPMPKAKALEAVKRSVDYLKKVLP